MRRRTSTLRPALYAGLLSLTLLLAGCADEDPQPKFEEPAASPTPEAETAEEFIRRWNDASNALVAGHAEEWRELTPDCATCQDSADQISSYYADGGYVRTKGREIMSIRALGESQGLHRYVVKTRSAPTSYRVSSTAEEQKLPGGKSGYVLSLSRSNGNWRFVDYTRES